MAFLTPAELLRVAPLRPELRAIVLPLMQAIEDATGKKVAIPRHGGVRTDAEQAALYAARNDNPFPVAVPGTSKHEYGSALDLNIIGGSDDDYAAMSAIAINMFGLRSLYPDDRVHVELNQSLQQCEDAWAAVQQSRGQMVGVAVAIGVALLILSESPYAERG